MQTATVTECLAVAALPPGYKRLPKPGEGRPSKYNPDKMPERARRLALLGLPDTELAETFNINIETLYDWKLKYPAFSNAIEEGKIDADAHIAASLYSRAKGMEIEEEQTFKVKTGTNTEELKTVKHKKQIIPDTRAAQIWLANRHRKRWGAKTEEQAAPQIVIDATSLLETARLITYALGQADAIQAQTIDNPPQPVLPPDFFD